MVCNRDTWRELVRCLGVKHPYDCIGHGIGDDNDNNGILQNSKFSTVSCNICLTLTCWLPVLNLTDQVSRIAPCINFYPKKYEI